MVNIKEFFDLRNGSCFCCLFSHGAVYGECFGTEGQVKYSRMHVLRRLQEGKFCSQDFERCHRYRKIWRSGSDRDL